MTTTWKKVTPKRPCVICTKPDWCTFAAEDGAACCMRVQSGKQMRNGGYLHKVAPERVTRTAPREAKAEKVIDWEALTQFHCAGFTKSMRTEVAKTLGVTVDSLVRLRTGFDGVGLTFPMSNAKGRVIGIRRRLPNADKTCVLGSKTGLFIPVDTPADGTIFVTEGPTDCAAILSLGLPAIGRPACAGGFDYLVALCRGRRTILIPDNDPLDHPARTHTENSIERLKKEGIDLKVIWPHLKDARAWVVAGLTREWLIELEGLV